MWVNGILDGIRSNFPWRYEFRHKREKPLWNRLHLCLASFQSIRIGVPLGSGGV